MTELPDIHYANRRKKCVHYRHQREINPAEYAGDATAKTASDRCEKDSENNIPLASGEIKEKLRVHGAPPEPARPGGVGDEQNAHPVPYPRAMGNM